MACALGDLGLGPGDPGPGTRTRRPGPADPGPGNPGALPRQLDVKQGVYISYQICHNLYIFVPHRALNVVQCMICVVPHVALYFVSSVVPSTWVL